MRPVSAGFLRTLRGSHVMAARARLVESGQAGVDPDGVETPIIAGDVLLDATAEIRSTLDLTTVGTWPTTPTDPLAPYGQEVFVERGVQYGNGTTEWISLGYFRLDDVDQQDAPKGAIRVAASDRMAGIVDARLVAPRQFEATRTRGSVVAELVGAVHPGAVIEWDDPETEGDQLGRQVIADEDRYGFLADLVKSVGKVWFWDYRGVLVIRDAPDVSTPVDQLDTGEGGVLRELARTLSRDGAYNGVVAVGEAPDTGEPVRAVAVDADPLSPTYWDGPFGQVPRFYYSPFLTTTAQAESAARAMLSRAIGLPYSLDLSAVPNPALEPLDCVGVGVPEPGARGYVTESHTLSTLRVPLTAEGALRGQTREQSHTTVEILQ